MANEGTYDVYLCFREMDTHTFTSNLFDALCLKGIKTVDFAALKNGYQTLESLLNAIEASRISIVVLSINFASSSYCLEELVKILECKRMNNQLICPIFYDVDPSQTGTFADVIGRCREERWRSALLEAANLKGWHFKTRYHKQIEFIQRIVEWVTKRSEPLFHYDVFLNFRGVDTRYSFTGFLYNALRQKGCNTFMDDDVLKSGNQISSSLLKAIEESRLSLIVLSENYAYSSWCLDELVKILECMKMKNQFVWPIFYKVDPSDVRHQRNSYGDAMAKHEKQFGNDPGKVQKWRSALFEVANLKGLHYETGYEYDVIEKIVETVLAEVSIRRKNEFLFY